MNTKQETADFLLEVWVEEIPAGYLKSAQLQLKTSAEKYLGEHNLCFSEIKSYATPNRLILSIKGLPLSNPKEEKLVFGPPEKVVYAPGGGYSVQAEGFARKYGYKPDRIKIIEGKAALKISTGGEKTKTILSKIMPELIAALEFPKTMIWEESCFRFARPIRNIFAMLGSDTVSFKIAGIKSSNKILGIHSYSTQTVVVKNAGAYFEKVRNLCVIIDPDERKEVILRQSQEVLKGKNRKLVKNDALVEEISYLTENPVAVWGVFDKSYLRLPEEPLVCCMKDKQRFLCISNEGGALANMFIGFRNGGSGSQETVREGFQRVLDARLKDVRFFYEKDTKTKLESKIEKLKYISQNEKLGSLYDKALRLAKITEILAAEFKLSDIEAKNAARAALLCKVDLASDMVFEYTELQGVMGGIYARVDGEAREVHEAIYEHYLPAQADDAVPKTLNGRILAFADKLDTLSSSFILGYAPKGSGDPYGLRRMALGIIRIIFESQYEGDLENLARESLALFKGELSANANGALRSEMEFIKQRLAVYFQQNNADYDVVDAVLSSQQWRSNIIGSKMKVEALCVIRKNKDFEPFVLLFRRAANILNQAGQKKLEYGGAVREDLCLLDEEKSLFYKCEQFRGTYNQLLAKKDYENLFYGLLEFKAPLTNFFDKVLVMAEEPNLRANRLSLINIFKKYFDPLADFSKIVLSADKK